MAYHGMGCDCASWSGWQSNWIESINRANGDQLPNLNDYFWDRKTLRGPTYLSGALNLTYTYRFKKWFELSGRFTYAGEYTNYYDGYDADLLLYRANVHSFGVMVVARFVWLHREYVRLFGIKAGKNVYGVIELSIGQSALISGGIGFNLSKWRK